MFSLRGGANVIPDICRRQKSCIFALFRFHRAVCNGFIFGIAFTAKIFFFGTNRSVQYSPCDHFRLSLHAIVAASRSTETLSSLCSDSKSMRSPFSPSIPLPVPLVIVRFVLFSLIYNGEFRVLIADFDLLLIGSEFICPD